MKTIQKALGTQVGNAFVKEKQGVLFYINFCFITNILTQYFKIHGSQQSRKSYKNDYDILGLIFPVQRMNQSNGLQRLSPRH